MTQWLTNNYIKEIVVYRSLSTNIFVNLALEDWILQNTKFEGRRILLLWRNTPCVVIGRHQNPWKESNVLKLKETGTLLARRRSGGGTVYHDLGNLNCTFFSHKNDYNRLRNLQLVCDAINGKWREVGLHISERHDITCQGKKVSGSAAKIAKDRTYHHFTLLIDTNEDHLKTLLQPDDRLLFSSSSATASVPSSTINLKALTRDMSYESVCSTIAHQFYKVHHIKEKKQNRVIDIDPLLGSLFTDITKLRHELESPNWIFGKTPKFSVQIEQLLLEVSAGIITSCIPEPLNQDSLIGTSFNNFLLEKINQKE